MLKIFLATFKGPFKTLFQKNFTTKNSSEKKTVGPKNIKTCALKTHKTTATRGP